MATNEEIEDSQTRHQTFSDRQTAGLVNQYVPILKAAEKPLIRGDDELDGIMDIYDVQTVEQAEALSLAEREVFISNLTTMYGLWYAKNITDQIFRPLRNDLKAKAVNEASFLGRSLTQRVAVSLREPSSALLNKFVFQTPYMGEFYRNYVNQYKNIALNNLRDLTSQRIIQGLPVGSIISEIQGTPSSRFNYSHNVGRLETHIITAAKHAETGADTAFFVENDHAIEGWRFFNVLDSETSEICFLTFSEVSDNGEKVWPPAQGPAPPLHFRCRSQKIASFKEGVL